MGMFFRIIKFGNSSARSFLWMLLEAASVSHKVLGMFIFGEIVFILGTNAKYRVSQKQTNQWAKKCFLLYGTPSTYKLKFKERPLRLTPYPASYDAGEISYVPNPNTLRYAQTPGDIRCYMTGLNIGLNLI